MRCVLIFDMRLSEGKPIGAIRFYLAGVFFLMWRLEQDTTTTAGKDIDPNAGDVLVAIMA